MKVAIHYTKPILRSAILAYVKRVYLKHLLWPTLAALALLVWSVQLESSWLQAFIVVLVLFIPLAILLGYWMRIQQSLKILELLEDGKAEMTISDEGVTTSSAIGESFLKWAMFSDLWDTPDAKLLLYTNNQFITLPKTQVPEAFFEAVLLKLRQKNTQK